MSDCLCYIVWLLEDKTHCTYRPVLKNFNFYAKNNPQTELKNGMCVFVKSLHLSEDVVRCIGAGERYVYRRNPGWTQITFTNLKRPSSKLHKVKGWFSSKGFIQLFYFGKKLQVLPESIFYYWFSTLCFCTFACYSKIFFNLNLPDFFLIKTKAAEVIFWPQG